MLKHFLLFNTFIFLFIFKNVGNAQQTNASIENKTILKGPLKPLVNDVIINEPQKGTLPNGITFYVVTNSKLPKVSFSLNVEIEPFIEKDKVGTTEIAGTLLNCGTIDLPKNIFNQKLDNLGVHFSTNASSISFSSLKHNFDEALKIITQLIYQPALPIEHFERIKIETISKIQAAKKDPNAISANVLASILYSKKHPYGEIATEQTIHNITLEDIKNFFNNYWTPSKTDIVFVGDISFEKAKEIVTQYFGPWQNKTVLQENISPAPTNYETYIALVDRPQAVQSNITIARAIHLLPNDSNAFAASIMNQILGGSSSSRLFKNLREKHGYTYGAYSRLKSDKYIGRFSASASVRSEKTDSAIIEFLNEFKRIQTEYLNSNSQEIKLIKNHTIGSYIRSLENNGVIADFVINIKRFNLPTDYYKNYINSILNVSENDIYNAANKILNTKNMVILVVGNAAKVEPLLKNLGYPIKYFDEQGNLIIK